MISNYNTNSGDMPLACSLCPNCGRSTCDCRFLDKIEELQRQVDELKKELNKKSFQDPLPPHNVPTYYYKDGM